MCGLSVDFCWVCTKPEAVFIPETNIFDSSDDDGDDLFIDSLTRKPKKEIKATCTKTKQVTVLIAINEYNCCM